MMRYLQLFSKLLHSNVFVLGVGFVLAACAPKVTAETQPSFDVSNFLDGAIADWASLLGPRFTEMDIKQKAIDDLRKLKYVRRDTASVLQDFCKDGVACRKELDSIICDYCSSKMEIIPKPLGVENDLFIGAHYWEIMISSNVVEDDGETDVVQNMHLRMAVSVRLGLADISRPSEIPHDFWSSERRRQLCEEAQKLMVSKPSWTWENWQPIY